MASVKESKAGPWPREESLESSSTSQDAAVQEALIGAHMAK